MSLRPYLMNSQLHISKAASLPNEVFYRILLTPL